jgi:hypothetical protein
MVLRTPLPHLWVTEKNSPYFKYVPKRVNLSAARPPRYFDQHFPLLLILPCCHAGQTLNTKLENAVLQLQNGADIIVGDWRMLRKNPNGISIEYQGWPEMGKNWNVPLTLDQIILSTCIHGHRGRAGSNPLKMFPPAGPLDFEVCKQKWTT